MNPQRTFARKVAYVVAIGLLLIPLFLLARPTSAGRPGGNLSQLREAQGLSEAQMLCMLEEYYKARNWDAQGRPQPAAGL